MGLDMTIYKSYNIAEIDPDKDEVEKIGTEVKYYRKFYGLHTWFYSNCKSVRHDWMDLYKITKDDLKKLQAELSLDNNGLVDEDNYWDYADDLKEFIETELNDEQECVYYYEYFS